MTRRILTWGAFALCASLVACDSDGGLGPGTCDIEPTLSSLRANLFTPGCVFEGCHESNSRDTDLDLESAGLHARLVGVLADDANARGRGKILIIPNDPDGSFLVQKLEGRQAADEGALMPDGADEPVDPDCRIAQLREWINRGALDD